jgi:hypothetical protein
MEKRLRQLMILAMTLTACASDPKRLVDDPTFKRDVTHCARVISMAWRDEHRDVDFDRFREAHLEHYIEQCVAEMKESR